MKKLVELQIVIVFVIASVYFFALHFGASKENALIVVTLVTLFATPVFTLAKIQIGALSASIVATATVFVATAVVSSAIVHFTIALAIVAIVIPFVFATITANELEIKYFWSVTALFVEGVVIYGALLSWMPVVVLGAAVLLFLRDADVAKT